MPATPGSTRLKSKPSVLPNSTAPSLRVRKRQLVRDAIWDAAIDLFAEKGFDETTIDDIAQSAGVSRRSFFRYFSSKSDLMVQSIADYSTLLKEAIESCPRTASLPQMFRHTVLQVACYSATQPRTRQIMQIVAKYPAARDAQIARVAELQEELAAAFACRFRKTGNDGLTPHVLAAVTLSVLGVTFRSWFDNGTQEISQTVDQVLATLNAVSCTT